MDFTTAARNYRSNRTNDNLKQQVEALVAEMTEKEKIYMLSGRSLLITVKNTLLHAHQYNDEPLPAGGCKRWVSPPSCLPIAQGEW